MQAGHPVSVRNVRHPNFLALVRRNAEACAKAQTKRRRCACACGGVLHGRAHTEEWIRKTAADFERRALYGAREGTGELFTDAKQ